MGSKQSSNKQSQQNRRQQESSSSRREYSPEYSRFETLTERNRNPYSYVQSDLQSNVARHPEMLYPNLQTINNQNRTCNTQSSEYVFVRSEGALNNPSVQRATAPPRPMTPPRPTATPRPTTPSRPMAPSHVPNQPSAPNPTSAARPFSRSVSRDRRNGNDVYNCPTCSNRFGMEIYVCPSGHSSCKQCRERGAGCGICGLVVTDTRNFAMQDFMSQIKVPCPNAADGCTLQIKTMNMDIHASECPFAEMACPMNSIFGNCRWRGKSSHMQSHFDDVHPAQRQGDVDTELVLPNICSDRHTMYFVPLTPFNFIFHVKVDVMQRYIYMTAQLLGTGMSAAKWNYEVHVYNKREPRRKYLFVSPCTAARLPVTEVFSKFDCAALPLQYALSFINDGILTYKFFIKKVNESSIFSGNERTRNDEHIGNRNAASHNTNFRGRVWSGRRGNYHRNNN